MSDNAALSDFILPAIIESSDEFNARAARAAFDRACRTLSWQAFWLAVFEYLEKHSAAIESVEFNKAGYCLAEKSMTPIPRADADPKLLDKAITASSKAFSKARGKFQAKNPFRASSAAAHAGPSARASLSDREAILERALGPDVYRMRLASLEKGALQDALSAEVFGAISGSRRRQAL